MTGRRQRTYKCDDDNEDDNDLVFLACRTERLCHIAFVKTRGVAAVSVTCSGARTNLKVGGRVRGKSAGNVFGRALSTFLALKVQLIVLVSALLQLKAKNRIYV